MKKLIVTSAMVAILAGFSSAYYAASAQAPQSSDASPHKVGLIDMAHVFKKYKKFEALREDLRVDITQSDQKARAMAERLKGIQTEIKEFKDGSPEFLKREKEIAQIQSDFEAFRKVAQRDFLRKESQIYKTIYLEVTDAVSKYASYYKYTLVMRFNRQDLDETKNPSELLQRMNRQVVYHRPEDDITDSVLDYLNRKYSPSTKSNSRSATRDNGTRAPRK